MQHTSLLNMQHTCLRNRHQPSLLNMKQTSLPGLWVILPTCKFYEKGFIRQDSCLGVGYIIVFPYKDQFNKTDKLARFTITKIVGIASLPMWKQN
jgi:hypothetical protein